MNEWRNRTAVLTGAGSGFGLECARLAADAGMHVVLVDVQADALARAKDEIAERAARHGGKVVAHRVDVSNDAEMSALAREVESAFGAPGFVFNNAGVSFSGLVWEASARDWGWVIGVNVLGVANGVRAFTPMMLAAAKSDPDYRGHIVNTASLAGMTSASIMGLYCASKHAVVAMTEGLQHDLALATDQVRAHLLCPYFVSTGIYASARNRPVDHETGTAGAGLTASQKAALVLAEQQVKHSGTVTAAVVAKMVFDAMRNDRFYIHTNPELLTTVSARVDDIVNARQPRDPFDNINPDRGRMLRATIQAGAGESVNTSV